MSKGQLARSYIVTERILGITDWARFDLVLEHLPSAETQRHEPWGYGLLRGRTQGGLEQLCSLLSLDFTEFTGESQGSRQEPWAPCLGEGESTESYLLHQLRIGLTAAGRSPSSPGYMEKDYSLWALEKRQDWSHSDQEMMGICTSRPGSQLQKFGS